MASRVYDVTNFLEEHPGGDEVLLAATEKDATGDYENVGHSQDAKEVMKKYYIGDIDEKSVPAWGRKKKNRPPNTIRITAREPKYNSLAVKLFVLLLLPLLLGVALALRFASKKH
ncbi:cytochrome B5-like [Jatropha curcas]|uniref:cytochrome B5-like n=1 Tax=Jatropha curcas TaxID=180498 RepID=UPI0005FBF1BE|nr:cytochrome B5-like [Jatropha curcas]